jgi:hypothetical protein
MLRSKRKELGDWPAWCFCPLAGARAVVSDGSDRSLTPEDGIAVGRIAALAAWRVSQGIYLIDQTILDAVMDTPMVGELPVDVLLALPEWCCYVRTPGHTVSDNADLHAYAVAGGYPGMAPGHGSKNVEIHGFFAHLEHDMNEGHSELRIQLDFASMPPWESLMPDILFLKPGTTFEDSYRAMLTKMRQAFERNTGHRMSGTYDMAEAEVMRTSGGRMSAIISILLYLCSETAEYHAGPTSAPPARPTRPSPKRTKEGWRLYPPDQPKIWSIGERLGRAIRDATTAERHATGDRQGPRPHVRRAHWHSFWRGPRADPLTRKLVLKWIPPIAVAMADDSPTARMKLDRPKRIKDIAGAIDAAAKELGDTPT